VRLSSIVIFALAAVSSLAVAQSPPDYGMPISGRLAKTAATAALAEMDKHGWNMAVAVVDPSGNLVYFEKKDATQHASIAIAIRKATAAATFKRPTKVFADGIANNPGIGTLPGVIASGGGIPIIIGGKLVGAIGCSGGTSQQDAMACSTGVAALE
jgi:glc operon protein GlcG